MIPEQQIAEAREICALIRAGKPVPCGKGPADEYLLALDAALSTALSDSKRKEEEMAGLREQVADAQQLANTHYDGKVRYRDRWAQEKAMREAAESRLKDAEAALADSERKRANQATALRMVSTALGNPDPTKIQERLESLIHVEALLAEARRERSASEKMREEILSTLHKVMAERDRLAAWADMARAALQTVKDSGPLEFSDGSPLMKVWQALASPAPKEDSK